MKIKYIKKYKAYLGNSKMFYIYISYKMSYMCMYIYMDMFVYLYIM